MTTDAGTPTPWPIEDVVARDLSGWARSLYNCTTGDNHLRTSEYYQLIRDLDAYEIVIAAAREQIAALTAAEAELAALRSTLRDHLDSEAAETKRADDATAERDALRARVAGLEAGLQRITDHFVYVMSGPLITGRGIDFENGVEGIPTIAGARALLAPSSEVKP